jgi:metal-responsive CopG/Arc/MetJ family transcriptional regulator
MASVKVAITLEQDTLRQVDSLVARRVFPNRSRAIQIALREKIDRVEGSRLAAECAKLDKNHEQALADAGIGQDGLEWPEF